MAGALLERDQELATLRARLDDARDGRGGLIVLEGQAGAGKSALIQALRGEARAADVRTCVAVGGELERDFPFGVVRQLLEPVVVSLDEHDRRLLLSGAASGAASLLGAGTAAETGSDGSFTTLHGLYWFVANLAEEAPLVLLVDDAHWSDEPSLRFLDYLSRRAPELSLLVVVAARPSEPGASQGLLNALAETAGADIVRPVRLSGEAVRRLVCEGLGFDPGDAVVAGAEQATAGNPLLLRELVRTIAAEGRAPTPATVSETVPASVVRSVSRRLARLAPASRQTARGLALLGPYIDGGVLAATTGQDQAAVLEGLQALQAVELVEGEPPRYVHPLVRAAVVQGIDAAERVAMHRAAAAHVRQRGGDLDELLLHVLAVPAIGERWAIDALRQGARRALREGAGSAAVKRLRRAREEASTLGMALDEIELELGSALLGDGDADALLHLEAAVACADDAIAAEALRIVLGSGYYHEPAVLVALIDRAEAVCERLEAAGRTVPADRLQAQIYAMLVQSPELTPRRLQMLASPPAGPPTDIAALLAFESCNRGGTRDEVAAWIARVLVASPLSDLEKLEQPLAFYAMEPALGIDRLEGWESAFRAGEAVARRNGSRLATAFLNFMTADWALTVGSVASAEARARAAFEHFASYGETTLLAALRGTLISALVRRGRLDEAQELGAQMPPDDELAMLYSGLFAFNRRAELHMAQRRPQDAVSELRQLDGVVRAFGWERFCQGYGRQLLARALVFSGEREEGLALARSEVQAGERRAIPGAHAQALISLGHAVDGDEALEAFAAAVEVATAGASPWVRATATFELGAALRRDGRRTDARRHLTVARDLAQRTDSTLLVDAAAAELLVAGGRPRRTRVSGVEALTASERRVAEHAAAGMSNREIAEALFVTRKTVELHLGNTFGKLGIRSRTQIAGILAGDEDPGTAAR